jgi:hypothetical protein
MLHKETTDAEERQMNDSEPDYSYNEPEGL